MVLKNDPRAVLDMLSKPVDVDEDEFLDNLDSKVRHACALAMLPPTQP